MALFGTASEESLGIELRIGLGKTLEAVVAPPPKKSGHA